MLDKTKNDAALAARLLVDLVVEMPVSELAGLLGQLDQGETVRAGAPTLAKFLRALGLSESGSAGCEAFRVLEGRHEGLLRAVTSLMDEHGLAFAPTLTDPEQAFEGAKAIVEGLASLEGLSEIRSEVPALLEQVLSGELVVLDGLPDARLRDGLLELFEALGLEALGGGEGDERGHGIPCRWQEDTKAIVRRVIAAYAGNKGDASSQGSDEEDGGADAGPRKPRGPLGPALPPPSVLVQAQQAAAAQLSAMGDSALSESSDEDDGPVVASKAKRVAGDRAAAPEIEAQRKRKRLDRAAEWERVQQPGNNTPPPAVEGKAGEAQAAPGGREEWMLVAPKSLSLLESLKTLQPTNRKFATRSKRGQQADKNSAGPPKPKSKAELEAEAEAEAVMREHRQARGPSLVERHKQDGDKKKAKGEKKPWSWNREDDMGMGHRKYNAQMYEELLQKSQQLDSKFTKSVQRNFL